MTTSRGSESDVARSAGMAAFGTFLDSERTAIAATIAQAPALDTLARDERDRLADRAAGAFIATLGDPEAAAAWASDLLGAGSATLDERHIALFLTALRQRLLDAALRALAAGVPGADEGAHMLMWQVDAAQRAVTGHYQERRESELRRVNARLEQSLATTPLSTVEWDKHGTVLRWNPAAERIFGWSAEEAIGRNIVQLLVPNVALDQVEAIVDALLSGVGGTSSRNLNIRKDGQLITCQWYNALLKDEHGAVIGALSQTEDVTEEIRAEEALRASQEQLIQAQQAALRELSTPLIPMADGVVAMPLIGSIDSQRAQQVIEGLLEGVAGNHARVAILDITGVPVVDTQVANALIRAAQAVKLLGARVVLTGIRPEVAQTLVGLGVDLTGIVTRGSLQAGIAYALNQG